MKYVWYNYFDVYSYDQCKQLNDMCDEYKSDYYKDRPALGKKVNTTLIETEKLKPMLDRFLLNVKQANEEFFGYKLFGDPYTVNLNEYSGSENEYPYHRDAMQLGSASDVKLTAVLNISREPSVGGEFEVFEGRDQVIPEISKPGNMLIFPSFMFHRVKPVLSGSRTTISAWFCGPNWR